MKLELFDFIDQTVTLFKANTRIYQYAVIHLEQLFTDVFSTAGDNFVSLHSRVKSPVSLKEKLIRNRFYLMYQNPREAIEHLSDLIGITVGCRFISNEKQMYDLLHVFFEPSAEDFWQCRRDDKVFLNMKMPQPQTQRNGFTIYRIDGYYMLNAERINFELQIKSMVHDFWSEIEHEVVYKNPEYVVNDQFYRQMLGAIRENLDVVDKQLEIMYSEISYESQNTRIGMDEKSFKVFISSSVNELVNAKMKGSLGFATDFKKCSATIAHYIYLNDFINDRADPGQKLLDYIQMLDYYNDVQIDFTNELDLGAPYESSDPFCDILGKYLASQINTNFIWHVFFVILLQLGQGTNMEDFDSFVHFIRTLLIQPGWFEARFAGYPEPQKTNLKKKLVEILAEALIEIGGIEIVYEDRLLMIMKEFRSFVEKVEKDNPEYADLKKVMRRMEKGLYHNITILFR